MKKKRPIKKKPILGNKSKLPRFMEEMEKVLNDPAAFVLTLTELVTYVNHNLEPEERIQKNTLFKWLTPSSSKGVNNLKNIDEETAEEFTRLIEYAKVRQKLALTGKMLDDEGKNKWGTAWLLERKFDDLKLNPKLEIGSGKLTLSIEGSGDISQTIDAIDIDHEDLTNQKSIE